MRPRGFTIVELTVALFVLLVAITVGMTAWSQALVNRTLYERRAAAREAVALTLERVRALELAALPQPGQQADVPLPQGLAPSLRNARCVLATEAVAGARSLVRVRVTVRWGPRDAVETGEALLRVPPADAAGRMPP